MLDTQGSVDNMLYTQGRTDIMLDTQGSIDNMPDDSPQKKLKSFIEIKVKRSIIK